LLALGDDVREQRLFTTHRSSEDDDLQCTVTLVEQAPLLVVTRDDTTLSLRYQPRYRPMSKNERQEFALVDDRSDSPSSALHPSSCILGSLDRHTRVPDLAIEVARPGHLTQVLVLDAKYRLDSDGRGVPQDALADAYTYLGAIGITGERATLGALLLYPGQTTAELYPSDVGAVPLRPEATDQLAACLAMFLGHDEPQRRRAREEDIP
ncbi:MAG: hypothetical protein HC828_08915, partial [Blastochloris sp.]|nr:hypothetical protein [Blastochloris sp.]